MPKLALPGHVEALGVEGCDAGDRVEIEVVCPEELGVGRHVGDDLRAGGVAHERDRPRVAAVLPDLVVHPHDRGGDVLGVGRILHRARATTGR